MKCFFSLKVSQLPNHSVCRQHPRARQVVGVAKAAACKVVPLRSTPLQLKNAAKALRSHHSVQWGLVHSPQPSTGLYSGRFKTVGWMWGLDWKICFFGQRLSWLWRLSQSETFSADELNRKPGWIAGRFGPSVRRGSNDLGSCQSSILNESPKLNSSWFLRQTLSEWSVIVPDTFRVRVRV